MLNSDETLMSALAHLREALALLDRADAPAQIGAHVDLAAHQLLGLLAREERGITKNSLGNCREGCRPSSGEPLHP